VAFITGKNAKRDVNVNNLIIYTRCCMSFLIAYNYRITTQKLFVNV